MPNRKCSKKTSLTAAELGLEEREGTRSKNGQFLPGHAWERAGQAVAARQVTVGGRAQALQLLDEVLGETQTKDKLREFFRRSIEERPQWFCEKLLVPLMPKQALLGLDDETSGEVTIQIFTAVPRPAEVVVEGRSLPAPQEQPSAAEASIGTEP